MHTRVRRLAIAVLLASPSCVVVPGDVEVGLERAVFPGLGDLSPDEIPAAFERKVELNPPISAGVAWLAETRVDEDGKPANDRISEFERTGVLENALRSLRQSPFAAVGGLPTVAVNRGEIGGRATSLDQVRAACAQFQFDVAIVLRTGIAEDTGHNLFAIGYLPIVTAPLFPGTDLAAAAGAELFAVDVRTGVPLAVGRGRAMDKDRLCFPWQTDDHRRRLREKILGDAIGSAARDLFAQLDQRLASE